MSLFVPSNPMKYKAFYLWKDFEEACDTLR